MARKEKKAGLGGGCTAPWKGTEPPVLPDGELSDGATDVEGEENKPSSVVISTRSRSYGASIASLKMQANSRVTVRWLS